MAALNHKIRVEYLNTLLKHILNVEYKFFTNYASNIYESPWNGRAKKPNEN